MSDLSATPIWQPSALHIAATRLTTFIRFVEVRHERSFQDYAALHRWSVMRREEFWLAVWDFCDVLGEKFGSKGDRVLIDGDKMPG